MPSVLLFVSLRDIPDLCPKGTDLGVKPSAPSCPLTLPLYLGGPNWTGWELGHPSSRDCPSLGRLFRGSKNYIEDFTGLTTLWPYLERCNSCLSTDMDSWLESLSFAGSFYFWRWMAWTWNKGKEGAQNSPPSYWKPRSSYNRAALLDVFLKDSSECMLRLDAKFADIEQERRKLLINS